MKYVLYRSLGNLDNQVKQHELVAVEYGSDIYEVTDALVRDVTDDDCLCSRAHTFFSQSKTL